MGCIQSYFALKLKQKFGVVLYLTSSTRYKYYNDLNINYTISSACSI